MIRKSATAFALLTLGIAVFGMSACETLKRTGAIQALAQTDIETLHKATVKTIEESGMNILEKPVDKFSGKVTSRTADGKDVRIILERIGPDTTQITVRVGLSDKSRAQLIMSDILERVR